VSRIAACLWRTGPSASGARDRALWPIVPENPRVGAADSQVQLGLPSAELACDLQVPPTERAEQRRSAR
jgi:hypothetical protein